MAGVTIVEFLLARIAEDEERARTVWAEDKDPVTQAALLEAWPNTLVAGLTRLNIAVRQLGWVVIATVPLARGYVMRRAIQYADHPDYRDEWRV